MSFSNILGIGLLIWEPKSASNCIAITVSERGLRDVEIIVSSNVADLVNSENYLTKYIEDVLSNYDGYELYIEVYCPKPSLKGNMFQEVKNDIMGSHIGSRVKGINEVKPAELRLANERLKNAYPFGDVFSGDEYLAGMAAVLANRRGILTSNEEDERKELKQSRFN